jgi:hypothetical protein
MILRFSQKLATKLKVRLSAVMPQGENPFADWTASLFTAGRTPFVLLTNTASLYSAVFYGRGITDDARFLALALDAIREALEHDGQEAIYQHFIAPTTGVVQLSKALNRSVTGSMNDLIVHAKMWLTEGDLSPHETSIRLNDIPFSPLQYRKPREVFGALAEGRKAD